MVSGSESVAVASPVRIRRAEPRDLPALTSLLQRYFVEGEVCQTDSPDSTRKQLDLYPLGFLIAEFEGQPAGCVLLHELKTIPKAAEAKRMFVAPEFRGHGIARQLLRDAETLVREAGYAWLYLDSKDNFATAIAMYRRHGFEDCERYHGCAEATVFLRKRLL